MKEWFDTVGQKHLEEFGRLLSRVDQTCKRQGHKLQEKDITNAIRIYRGENVLTSECEVEKILELRKNGLSMQQIANMLDIGFGAVEYTLRTKRKTA